jgi:amino acid transporter
MSTEAPGESTQKTQGQSEPDESSVSNDQVPVPNGQDPVANRQDPSRNAILVAVSVATVMLVILALFALEERFFSSKRLSSDLPKTEPDKTEPKQPENRRLAIRDRYIEWTADQNVQVFEWHARSTKIIFWVSMLITVTGIVFAFWQFVEASKTSHAAEQTDKIELKNQFISLAFRSRSLATFMMFVAITYLLIYVTLVYPITTVEGPKTVMQSLDTPTSHIPSVSRKVPGAAVAPEGTKESR